MFRPGLPPRPAPPESKGIYSKLKSRFFLLLYTLNEGDHVPHFAFWVLQLVGFLQVRTHPLGWWVTADIHCGRTPCPCACAPTTPRFTLQLSLVQQCALWGWEACRMRAPPERAAVTLCSAGVSVTAGVACCCHRARGLCSAVPNCHPPLQLLAFPLDASVLAWRDSPTMRDLFVRWLRPLAQTGLEPVVSGRLLSQCLPFPPRPRPRPLSHLDSAAHVFLG
jgi:hypothetical protein